MTANIDLSGRVVLVVGRAQAARRALSRHRAAGAVVRHAEPAFAADGEPDAVLAEALAAAELIVAVGLEPLERRAVGEAAARHRVLVADAPAATSDPRVTLVGGGPGPRSLLTQGALSALDDADVVLYDRLGPHDNLAELCPGALLIDVGKTPGHHAVPQSEIERMLVQHALQGNHVVRLKGGDPFVFGRGGEEVIACRSAGVPVNVISGVTSAIAVPAAAGIPVTHREVSKLFTVVSGHVPLTEDELGHLAGLGGTIVVLMGVNTLPHLMAGLARHGMRADMPVAVVERGWHDDQRTTLTVLRDAVDVALRERVRSPAVLVIGEVVALAERPAADASINAALRDILNDSRLAEAP